MTQNTVLSIAGIDSVRRVSLGDPEICIAIIDSRVDLSHPVFAGAQLRELMPAWLTSRMGPAGASHGTHVASIIFGQPGGPLEGIAPRCRGVVIPVYGETENGELTPCSQEDLGRAISLALEAGARLINISGGELIDPGDEDPLLAKIVRSCEQQGVVIVAATGNEGCECLHAPATFETVLAVGAANASGRPMPFSNWDVSLADHGILAPGEGILGAVPGGGLAVQNGTSFACPIVTGAASLLLGLQKLRGEKPSPRAVRDALVATAIPCAPEDKEAECERMLGGRLNVVGAYRALFEAGTAMPSGAPPPAPLIAEAIRAPPAPVALAVRPAGDGDYRSSPSVNWEENIVTYQHAQAQPLAGHGMEQGVAPLGVEAHLQLAQPQPSEFSARAPASGAVPGVAPMTVASQQLAMEGQLAGAQPQGVTPSCGCGGAQPAQSVSPSQQDWAAAQQQTGFHPSLAYPGGMAGQAAPFGVQPVLTPGQRTAMIAGSPGLLVGRQTLPASRGVAPSQMSATCPCPMPNDFISAENSQLVYAIGTLGYDFITDARRDYFVQKFVEMSSYDAYINLFKPSLGLQTDVVYYPEDHRAMAAYLFQEGVVPPGGPDPTGGFGFHVEDAGSVVWVLFQENQPQYALRPLHTFAFRVLFYFCDFLFNQSRPDYLLAPDGKPVEKKPVNPDKADRVSIAGRIVGEMTLYNGQRVPVLDVSLRALFQWNVKKLIEDLGVTDIESDLYKSLETFLDRIYYECRNLGQAPSDRAINYMATNVFEVGDVFRDALKATSSNGSPSPLALDSIYAEKSPICRPKSDCWDVVMRFFNPKDRLGTALTEYRLTVDVNDVSPVSIGTRRQWARFA